ncbi:MAG TPA: GNAT family N-acetyltransferase [Flavobacterium sp.]|nr:GNAT family N-acetyltransferase [Flavobacterium sp.]
MNLKGTSIFLRALEPEDLDYLYEVENNMSIWELSSTQTPYSQFVLKQYIERSLSADIYGLRELRLVICTHLNHSPIGLIDLFDFDPKNKRAGIGIVISDSQNRGLGYASEALELLIDYSFEVLDLHQLHCDILSENTNSLMLFQKFGFKEIGNKKDWIFDGQNYKDELLYQLINPK